MEKIKVLIVDDFALIRTAWKAMFASEKKYRVVAEAKNGLEAIELCKKMEIDVVLMDITMPVMDGIEATRAICEEKGLYPKIIGLSMHTEKQFVRKMMEAGASGYVTKDASFRELCDAIEIVLKNGSYLSENLRYNTEAD